MEKEFILETYPPRIRGRLHHALPLSIIPNDLHFDEWFYSNYIQLSCGKGEDGHHDINFHEAYIWNHKYPHFHVIGLNRNNLSLFNSDIVTALVNVLMNNYYIHTYINEFHSPLQFGGVKDAVRDILIHGFNLEDQCFHILGYRKNVQLGSEKIKFDDFIQAFHAVSSNLQWAQDIYLYQRRFDITYKFDKEHVIELLKDYIYSLNSSRRIRGITNPHDYIFGLDSVRRYKEMISQSNRSIGLAPIFTLYEHKQIMMQRMNFISTNDHTENKSDLVIIMDDYKSVVHTYDVLRMKVTKYNITLNQDLLSQICSELDAIIEIEKEILVRLLNLLES